MTTYGPYSPIKQAGNLYFVSGQVGVDSQTKTAAPDVAEQTRQVLLNLKNVLATAKLQMSDVVKTTVYLRSMDDFATMNEVYVTYFDEPRPARACVAVAELPRVGNSTDILVEIEAVAYKEENKSE